MFLMKKRERERNSPELSDYVKGLSFEELKILKESDPEESLNVDNDATVTHHLTDGEIM